MRSRRDKLNFNAFLPFSLGNISQQKDAVRRYSGSEIFGIKPELKERLLPAP